MENLERYYDAKVQAGGSKITTQSQAVHFGSKSMARAAISDSDSVEPLCISLVELAPGGFHLHQCMRMMMITTSVSWGRTVICELQPVGHRSITSK
jgi:hypothetical protein